MLLKIRFRKGRFLPSNIEQIERIRKRWTLLLLLEQCNGQQRAPARFTTQSTSATRDPLTNQKQKQKKMESA
jgi:hypothetical protein